jgi:hypothetical protein
VPYGPGGVGDLTIRLLTNKLSQNLKQPFVIENRPGAGGIAAMRAVLSAPADGSRWAKWKRAVDQHEPVPGPALRRAEAFNTGCARRLPTGRRTVRRRALFALAKYEQVYLKITPVNVTPKSWGNGAPETFFGKVVDTFGASRIAWGSNFPNSPGTLAEILAAARQAFSFAKASDQEWIFRQDCDDALSGACRILSGVTPEQNYGAAGLTNAQPATPPAGYAFGRPALQLYGRAEGLQPGHDPL